MENKKERPIWKHLFKLKKSAPVLYKFLFIYIIAEIFVICILPFILDKTIYLSFYLSSQAKEKTHLFFKNQNSMIPDEVVGWKNRPMTTKKSWIIDENGSRATHKFSFDKQKSIRVMFLGSSMINGGTRISNHETISAYLEDDMIETINFGTMMYSLDQVLLSYRTNLYKYNEDILVVGIDIEANEGLINHYIPFRFPQEENVPYIKPRFEICSGNLRLIEVSPKKMLENIPNNNFLIKFLSENDSFYYKFDTFCYFGMLPVSGSIRNGSLKLIRLEKYFVDNSSGDALLLAIINEIKFEAEKNGSRVIFLMNTDKTIILRSGIYRFLKDLYNHQFEMLLEKGLNVIDIRSVFLHSHVNYEILFDADQSHYSASGNKIIADKLKVDILKASKLK